jgi:hypothetical protein
MYCLLQRPLATAAESPADGTQPGSTGNLPGSTQGPTSPAVASVGTEGRAAVVGLDNSSGNVNKQHFVKRSCTEAMLKVRGDSEVDEGGLGQKGPLCLLLWMCFYYGMATFT